MKMAAVPRYRRRDAFNSLNWSPLTELLAAKFLPVVFVSELVRRRVYRRGRSPRRVSELRVPLRAGRVGDARVEARLRAARRSNGARKLLPPRVCRDVACDVLLANRHQPFS